MRTDNYLRQLASAEKMMDELHKRLVAEGYYFYQDSYWKP